MFRGLLTHTFCKKASAERNAQVAELVDALASGASVLMDVEVRVFSWAPYFTLLFLFPGLSRKCEYSGQLDRNRKNIEY